MSINGLIPSQKKKSKGYETTLLNAAFGQLFGRDVEYSKNILKLFQADPPEQEEPAPNDTTAEGEELGQAEEANTSVEPEPVVPSPTKKKKTKAERMRVRFTPQMGNSLE